MHGSWIIILLLATFANQVYAVKKFLFRECNQNPFCDRNRHYAKQVDQLAKSDWTSPYEIALDSISYSSGHIGTLNGNIIKSIGEKTILLPFDVTILKEGGVRITVDEQSRNDGTVDFGDKNLSKRRYDVSNLIWADNIQFESKFHYSIDGNILTVPYGDGNEVRIQASPVKFSFYRNGVEQVVLNDQQFFNFEHWRPKIDGKKSPTKEQLEQNAFESDNGLWEDSFDNHRDLKKKGPESVALDIFFTGYSHVYGIPEHADKFSLRETHGGNNNHDDPYRLFNVDIFEYDDNSPMPMYGSIPFMQAQKADGSAGVFWANAADTFIDIKKSTEGTATHWISENGKIDVYVFLGDVPEDISRQYGKMTGFTTLPAEFAIGYHQCRWNYNSQDDVLEVSQNFDNYQIPYDVIWLDVEYTIAKKYFTWNEDTFPDHLDMLRQLDMSQRKLVAIIDPHIKAEAGYDVYDYVKDNSLAVSNSNLDVFHGHCWPGESVWIDALNPDMQQYWDTLFSKKEYFGGDAPNLHIWNDMNEPSVFSGPETSMPKDNIHYGGWEHRDLHNIWGMPFHNATYNSLEKRYGGETRPFVLTRSFFAGSQRTAAMWTGDNMAKWEYLKVATPMVLTQQIAGMPFAGADVGGFFGNPEPELLARWYQAGAFYPFFRAHAHIDTRRREPWLPEAPYNDTIIDAIKLRYKLLPVFYTAFYESSISGSAILKPTFFVTPQNELSYDLDDQFYVGDSGLLVKPVTEKEATSVQIFVADDELYYDYNTHKQVGSGSVWINYQAPLDTVPMLMRGGHIHARKDRNRRSSTLMRHDPYTIVVAVSGSGSAEGKVYADDGQSFEHEKGEYLYQKINYSSSKLSAKPEHVPSKGAFFTKIPIGKIELIGVKPSSIGEVVKITEGGKSWEAEVIKLDNSVVIRTPKVTIGGEWVVEF